MVNGKFTNEVYQNNMKDDELEYIPEKHQPYFEFDFNGNRQLIGLDQILLCLRIAEKVNEIPSMSLSFWQSVSENYGINYFDVDVKNPDYIMEPRRPEDMTQLNKDILQSAHDHFGECLYIISKITGLYISNNLAEKITNGASGIYDI